MTPSNSGFWADFRVFLMRGNVIDLAIAVIIGGAFSKITSSLVEDIITPALLSPALKAAKVDQLQNLSLNGIKYGVFLAAVLNFLIICFCIFVIIRAFGKAEQQLSHKSATEEAAVPVDTTTALQEPHSENT